MQVEKLGTLIKRIRVQKGLSTRELVQRVKEISDEKGITASQINKIENNKVNSTFQTLQKLAVALDLPLILALDGSQETPDTVLIISGAEVSEDLQDALRRTSLVELLMYCKNLDDAQVNAILSVARSIRECTQAGDQARRP